MRKLGARGIEAQRPEMAGLDDGGDLLGLVARRKKGSEKGDRPGSRMDPGQVDKVGSIWRASSPGGRRVVVIAGLPVVAWASGADKHREKMVQRNLARF